MNPKVRAIMAQNARLLAQRRKERPPAPPPRETPPPPKYADPVAYARDVLGILTLTPDQQTILRHLTIPPRRVLVPSGHDTGKTFLAAVAVNWWYDSHDPGAVFTIGPRKDSLRETVWAEVRLQRARAAKGVPYDFIGPSAPEMRSSEDHWARAFTASKDASLTGRHLPNMLFLIEEAIGVDPIWWEVINTMFDPSLGHSELAIFNPTDTTTQAYLEDQRATDADGNLRWHRFRLSALNHPNVLSELAGGPKVIRAAVSLAQVEDEMKALCEPVAAGDVRATDFEWRPSSGQFYRPGPVFQARWLGLWPDTGAGVWSDALWEAVNRTAPVDFPPVAAPQLGCDCATGKGDDFHAIHARWGCWSLHHETANTMDPPAIFGRLKECCRRLADFANARREATPLTAKGIPVKIDDDGTGNAVGKFLAAEGYNVILIGAGTAAADPERYPRRRDELWFQVAERARAGLVRLLPAGVIPGVGLDRPTLRRLKQQLMAPAWGLDGQGRRKVEPKDDTKEKIGRSPDDADALNLGHYEAPSMVVQAVEPEEEGRRRESGSGPYGRRR